MKTVILWNITTIKNKYLLFEYIFKMYIIPVIKAEIVCSFLIIINDCAASYFFKFYFSEFFDLKLK